MRTLLLRGSLLGWLLVPLVLSAAQAADETTGPLATDSLAYSCETEFGELDFTAVISTDLPRTLLPGESTRTTLSNQLAIHPDFVSQIRSEGYTSATATGILTVTIDGIRTEVPLQASSHHLETPLFVFFGGQVPAPLTAGDPGSQIRLLAGNLVVEAVFSGPSTDTHSSTLACTLDANQNTVIDAVTVVAGNDQDDVEPPDVDTESDPPPVDAEPTDAPDSETEDESAAAVIAIQVPPMVRAGQQLVITFPGALVHSRYDFSLRDPRNDNSLPIGSARVNEDHTAAVTIPDTVTAGIHLLDVMSEGEVVATAEVEVLAIEPRGWTAPLASAASGSGGTTRAVLGVGAIAVAAIGAFLLRARHGGGTGHRASRRPPGSRVKAHE